MKVTLFSSKHSSITIVSVCALLDTFQVESCLANDLPLISKPWLPKRPKWTNKPRPTATANAPTRTSPSLCNPKRRYRSF